MQYERDDPLLADDPPPFSLTWHRDLLGGGALRVRGHAGRYVVERRYFGEELFCASVDGALSFRKAIALGEMLATEMDDRHIAQGQETRWAHILHHTLDSALKRQTESLIRALAHERTPACSCSPTSPSSGAGAARRVDDPLAPPPPAEQTPRA